MFMGLDLILLAILGSIAYNRGFLPQINQPGPAKSSQTALEILKERYARGEITSTEYQQMRQDLTS